MKLSYIVLGVIMVFVSLIFLIIKWNIYNIERKGSIVEMKIVNLPRRCDLTKARYFMNVNFQVKIFNKRIPVGFCHKHKKGELIKMKFLEGERIILFPNERVFGEFIAIGVFLLMGILSIVYGASSKRVQ